jgi:hypothetical protein
MATVSVLLMKESIIKSLKELVADRFLLILTSVMLLISFISAIVIGFSIHSSELQLVSHYSAFGITHLYRDQWFYLFVFVVFVILVAILNSVISVKLLVTKGRPLAIMFTWLSIGIIFLGWVTASSVLNVWTPL